MYMYSISTNKLATLLQATEAGVEAENKANNIIVYYVFPVLSLCSPAGEGHMRTDIRLSH